MRKLTMEELNRKSINEFKAAEKTPICIVLDDVRSLHNIGSVFRTSDAFLLEKIYLCGITATPPNKEMNKTALGATETVAWEYQKNITDVLQHLKNKNYTLLSVEQVENSVFLNTFEVDKTKKYALIFGNEVMGVSDEAIQLSDTCLEIPQLGSKHSLNISVSVGVVVWDLFQKLQNS